jgi:branched-chain amino acid aminotransferase
MSDQAWLNGRLVAADSPALLVGDRGFQLGDGLFETLRVRRGVVIEIGLHLARLREAWAPRDHALLDTSSRRSQPSGNASGDAAVRSSRGAVEVAPTPPAAQPRPPS